MGIMPPYDPFEDRTLHWVLGRVVSIEPARPTWSRPGIVRLAIEEVLRAAGPTPPSGEIALQFGPPREAAQERFYVDRGFGPVPAPDQRDAHARAHAELDARPIAVPDRDARVVVWCVETTGGAWDVPTLRALSGTPFPMGQRWIDAAHLPAVRARLG